MAEPNRPAGRMARPALLVAGLVAAGFAVRALGLHGLALPEATRRGAASLVLLGAVACAIGAPRQAVAFAGGYAHGLWLGTGLALLAQLLGCAVDVVWARLVARGWVRARLAGRFGPRLARLDRLLAARPFLATLTLRLLPVGNNLALNLLAGGFGVRVLPFLAASAIGYLPQTIIFALLGSGVRLAHGVSLAVACVLFAASIALGAALLRHDLDAAP